jgi:GAF domain-containing protein
MTQVDGSRRVEEAAARLNSSVLALSRCNRVLWQARDEQELLQSICQILVETAGVRLVWIGYCEDDAEKTVRPVARAGNGLDYLDRVKISWGNSEAGRGPVGDAIRTARFCWVDDIRTDPRFSHGRTEAMALGYFPALHFPWSLMRDRRVFSIFVARLPFMPTLSTGAKSNDMRIWHRT